MTSYYNPTTFAEKIKKILQLYWLFLQARFRRPRSRNNNPRGTAVLMIVPHLDIVGGLERQALELSGSLTRLGNWVTILSDRISKFPSKEFQSGFLIYRIPFRARRTQVNLLISVLFFFFRHHRYQVVHAHGVTGLTLFALRVAKALGMKTILKGSTRNDFADIFLQQSRKHRCYRKWIKQVDCFIAISEELRQEMLSCGIPKSRIRRISNFVNTVRFVPCSAEWRQMLRSRFSVQPDQLVFLFLGRLEERKGVDFLLRAWGKSSPGLLWIVGSGPAEQKWKKVCEELQLENVRFHGTTLTPLDFYHAADTFVLPSIREGSPNVLLEAMSCGLPCIATKIGGIEELLQQDQQGLLVPPGSTEDLAQAIGYAAARPEDRKRWSESALQTVRSRFALSRIASTYVSLYSDLLS